MPKFNTMYTNTGKVQSVIGLVVVTVLTAYASSHATEIVDKTVEFCKDSVKRVEEVLHKGKRRVSIIERMYDGSLRDTKKTMWVDKH